MSKVTIKRKAWGSDLQLIAPTPQAVEAVMDEIESPLGEVEVSVKYNQTPRFMHMKHLNIDVVEAAKRRIRWLIENHEEVWVSFSGGKDSLVVLKLVEMVYAEMGRTDKVNVKFMDEELVDDKIIEFVQEMADSGRYNFRWFALQMYVGFYVMGKHKPFVSWDPARKWHRQLPDRDYVITDVGIDTKDCNENTIAKHCFKSTTKKIAILLGVRADESQKRFFAVSRGASETQPNYVSMEFGKNAFCAKPIYDMTEMDVFKFFKEYGIKYCPIYDQQVWAKAQLRVASAMHERAISQFMKMKELSPHFYEQLRSIYPEIETHYRYNKEMAKSKTMGNYPPTFEGIRSYIKDNIDPSHQEEATKLVNGFEARRKVVLEKEPHMPLGRVSVLQIFHLVMSGGFVKHAPTNHKISQMDIDFEAGVSDLPEEE